MNDVRVHANSSRPKQIHAHAYTQGADIYLGPGQERHLAHEAWHVVQQKRGGVKPTLSLSGAAINDDPAFERDADRMAAKLRTMSSASTHRKLKPGPRTGEHAPPVQRVVIRHQPNDAAIKKAAEDLLKTTAAGHKLIDRSDLANYSIGKTETVYVLGHGGGMAKDEHGGSASSATRLAGVGAQDLAKEMAACLPNGFSGHVYLVQCSGAGKSQDGAPTFAQDFTNAVHAEMGKSGFLGFGKKNLGADFQVHAAAGNIIVSGHSGGGASIAEGEISYIPQNKTISLMMKSTASLDEEVVKLAKAIQEEHAATDPADQVKRSALVRQNNELVQMQAVLRGAADSAMRTDLTIHKPGTVAQPPLALPSDPLVELQAAMTKVDQSAGALDEIEAAAAQFIATAKPAGLGSGVGQAGRQERPRQHEGAVLARVDDTAADNGCAVRSPLPEGIAPSPWHTSPSSIRRCRGAGD